MQERIIEIVMYLLNEVRRTKKTLDEVDLEELHNLGYSQAEITSAFTWLYERYKGDPSARIDWSGRAESFRILHPAEQQVITPEAYGYLIQLHHLQMITHEELEMVVERSMMSGFERISEADMQSIVSGMLFEGEAFDAMKGRPFFLSNDSIH